MKKKAKKKVAKKKKPAEKAKKVAAKNEHGEKLVGVVTHFYTNIKVAVIKFKAPFKAGTQVHFCGATTDFNQKIASIQYDHKAIKVAKKGQGVGVKVAKRVREGDEVYLAK